MEDVDQGPGIKKVTRVLFPPKQEERMTLAGGNQPNIGNKMS